MKNCLLIGLCFFGFSAPVFAETCGLYMVEDFGDRTLVSLTDLKTSPNQPLTFTITNPDSQLVRSLVHGLCYCLAGETALDPQFDGDPNYLTLQAESVLRGPYDGCALNPALSAGR